MHSDFELDNVDLMLELPLRQRIPVDSRILEYVRFGRSSSKHGSLRVPHFLYHRRCEYDIFDRAHCLHHWQMRLRPSLGLRIEVSARRCQCPCTWHINRCGLARSIECHSRRHRGSGWDQRRPRQISTVVLALSATEADFCTIMMGVSFSIRALVL